MHAEVLKILNFLLTPFIVLVYTNRRKEGLFMPLAMVACGETRTIQSFNGDENLKQHLLDIGLVPGEKVEVIGENSSGLILKIKGVRLALNRGLAQRITVY